MGIKSLPSKYVAKKMKVTHRISSQLPHHKTSVLYKFYYALKT